MLYTILIGISLAISPIPRSNFVSQGFLTSSRLLICLTTSLTQRSILPIWGQQLKDIKYGLGLIPG